MPAKYVLFYSQQHNTLEQLLAAVPAGLPRPENRAGEFAALQQQAVQRCTIRQAVLELREVTAYDELELDTLGDRKTALFLIMSDTDDSFNFLISMCYTQLFNLLCEKADDVYGGRLPVHVRCLIDECANIRSEEHTSELQSQR